MKISTKGRYALEAVLDLALYSETELESLNNISERLNISKNYLEQLFSVLRKNNIVASVRGAQGGYRLARDIDTVTAGDVIRAVEGPLSPVSCLDDNECANPSNDYELCVTRALWKKMMSVMGEAADSVSLRDLVIAYNKMNKEEQIDFFI